MAMIVFNATVLEVFLIAGVCIFIGFLLGMKYGAYHGYQRGYLDGVQKEKKRYLASQQE